MSNGWIHIPTPLTLIETKCSEFQKAYLISRWRLAQSKQLCFRCLRGRHRSEDCKHGDDCQEPDCDNKFHHLLHYHPKKTSSETEKKTEIQKRKEEQPAVDKPKENEDSNYVKKLANHKIALRTAPVILVNRTERIKAIAFLNDGSTGTYIRENILENSGLKGEMASLKISTVQEVKLLIQKECKLVLRVKMIRAWATRSITPGMNAFSSNN